MPEGQWTVTPEERAEIQALGRKLSQWLMAQFSDRDSVHIKMVAGAFQYVMQLQKEKSTAIGDDFLIAQKAIEEFGISDRVDEPFAPLPTPEPPTEIEEATPVPSVDEGPSGPAAPSEPVAPSEVAPVEPEAPVQAPATPEAPAPAADAPVEPEAPASPESV